MFSLWGKKFQYNESTVQREALNKMRRLPIYFLIDVSESMVGEPIEQVQQGLESIIKALRADPFSLETVYLSVLVFAGEAKVLEPLQEIVSYYPPHIPIGSGTSLGKGLALLMQEIEKNKIETTTTQRGDWKPIVYLFTDGRPTDAYETQLQKWETNYRDKINTVAVSIGNNVSPQLLERFSENVLDFSVTGADDYKKFFRWVSDSIKVQSLKIETEGNDQLGLERVTESGARQINLRKPQDYLIDDQVAVFLGQCQNKKEYYLIKYRRVQEPSVFGQEMGFAVSGFNLENAYKIDKQTYRMLSEDIQLKHTVNTSELRGAPNCPCCGNQIAFAYCGCGSIFCMEDVPRGHFHEETCPWCDSTSSFGYGGGDFEVNRTQG